MTTADPSSPYEGQARNPGCIAIIGLAVGFGALFVLGLVLVIFLASLPEPSYEDYSSPAEGAVNHALGIYGQGLPLLPARDGESHPHEHPHEKGQPAQQEVQYVVHPLT